MLGPGLIIAGLPLAAVVSVAALRGAPDSGLARLAFGLVVLELAAGAAWLWKSYG